MKQQKRENLTAASICGGGATLNSLGQGISAGIIDHRVKDSLSGRFKNLCIGMVKTYTDRMSVLLRSKMSHSGRNRGFSFSWGTRSFSFPVEIEKKKNGYNYNLTKQAN